MSRHSYRFRRTRRRQFVREQPVWPLPAITGHPPVIVTIDQHTHEATLAYGRPPLEKSIADSPFFMPASAPVLAIKSGVVASVIPHDGVHRVILHHGNDFATDYEGLDETIVSPGERRHVKAGEVIGMIRCPGPDLRGLRFTLSRLDLVPGLPGFPRSVDPLDVLLGTVSIPLAAMTLPPTKEEAA